MKEIWKDINGFNGNYKVSNLGKFVSIGNGRWKSETPKYLKPYLQSNGYYNLTLYKNKIGHKKLIHRLLAEVFIDKKDGKPHINHKDGNPKNNKLENLEWVSHKENIQHSFDVLGHKGSMFGKFGKDSRKSKKIGQYTKSGDFIKIWYGALEIYRDLGISAGNISAVCNGKRKTAGGYKWIYI